MRRRRRGRSRRRSGAKTRQQAALPCLEVAVKYGEVWIREKLSTAVAQQNGRIACKLRRKGHGRKGRNQPSVRRTPTHALNQIQSSGYCESLSLLQGRQAHATTANMAITTKCCPLYCAHRRPAHAVQLPDFPSLTFLEPSLPFTSNIMSS
jgi:hypothetical protein